MEASLTFKRNDITYYAEFEFSTSQQSETFDNPDGNSGETIYTEQFDHIHIYPCTITGEDLHGEEINISWDEKLELIEYMSTECVDDINDYLR